MTGSSPSRTSPYRALVDRRFVRHYLQMLAAMLVGMAVLGRLSTLLGDGVAVEVHALLMAAYMTTGMAAWMAYRRHGWWAIAEMGIAMFAAFVVLFPPLWAGLLTSDTLFVAGHVLMLPAMALAMLHRREEYLAPHEAAEGDLPGPSTAASPMSPVDRGAGDTVTVESLIARLRT